MEKLLVTTDLSVNSRAGLRFAIQYAQQNNAELIVLHVYYLLRASNWDDELYGRYQKKAEEVYRRDLDNFVKSVYRSVKVEQKDCKAVLINHMETEQTIIQYAYANQCDYIVMSARGEGLLPKVFGNTATRVMNLSSIPVILVPKNYRKREITSILYASDLTGEQDELKRVVKFARPVNAKVELRHFSEVEELVTEIPEEGTLSQALDYPVSVMLDNREFEISLAEDIEEAVAKARPSVVAMFTHQKRTLLDRLFIPSNARQLTFRTKVPLLIFNKKTA